MAEGEGRNAVFPASLGLEIPGVDGSEVGLAKAHKLTESKGVTIRTEVADLAAYVPTALLSTHHLAGLVCRAVHIPHTANYIVGCNRRG